MTIDAEMLMAYADGELDLVSAKRVEKAIAADPALAAQVEQHRALKAALGRHFDPIAAAPVPDALAARLRESASVVDLAVARESRAAAQPRMRWWRGTGALAASLALGVVLGVVSRPAGDFTARGGQLIASGKVAAALDTQLAAQQGGAIRVPVSFRATDGAYCRTFETAGQGGIACREGAGWAVRQLRASEAAEKGEYRQAGSAAVMADAQAMMAGEPLDAEAERAAIARGWR